MTIDLDSMAIEVPAVEGHPNRTPFRGVLTLVDVASDGSPSGARGHRVVLTRAAAEAALASLLGMGLDSSLSWEMHDAQRKVGIITEAEILGKRLELGGYIFAKDFPEIVRELQNSGRGLGMSYEVTDAQVADLRAQIWTLTHVTFTGAAILRRTKAAYRDTWIELGARH